jgi:hypothetical protein
MATPTPLKREITFVPGEFGTTKELDGPIALAKRLQTLMLMESHTIPNLADAGVGIRTYLYEFSDSITENILRSSIMDQVNKFLPNTVIMDVQVIFATDPGTGKKMIVVYFILNKKIDNVEKFAMTFGLRADKRSSLFSDIYI